MTEIITYYCEDCEKNGKPPQPLGEFSATRSMQLHGRIICGDCAQRANPVYQEWKREMQEAV